MNAHNETEANRMKKAHLIQLILCSLLLIFTYNAFAVTLPYGTTGPDVRSLQLRLSELGYYTADISGEFDMPTQAAVDTFCRQTGLRLADGISDETWNQLFSQDAPIKTQKTQSPIHLRPLPMMQVSGIPFR